MSGHIRSATGPIKVFAERSHELLKVPRLIRNRTETAHRSMSGDVYLNAEDAEDDEEGAADEDDVADGLEGRDEGLDHQLQAWSPADHPEGQTLGL